MKHKKILFVVIVVLTVAVCEAVVGVACKALVADAPDVDILETNVVQALLRRSDDVLILGSSRAHHQYDSRVISRECGMSCYNAGYDHQDIFYDLMIFNAYIKRHKPKIVVMDIFENMLNGTWSKSLSEMNCFYRISPDVRKVIDSRSDFTARTKLKSSLLCYNRSCKWLLTAYTLPIRASLGGYDPAVSPVDTSLHYKVWKHKFVPRKSNLRAMNQIIESCKRHDIRLVFVYSPTLNLRTRGCAAWMKDFCKKRGLEFHDFSWDKKYYLHPLLFRDAVHLNDKGADVFSHDMGRILRHS